jgi:hypothetical protein
MIDRVKIYIEENNLKKGSFYYSRKDRDKWRRYHLMTHLRLVYDMRLAKIGTLFSLDHATIIHGLKRYKDLKNDKDFKRETHALRLLFPNSEGCEHKPENRTISLLTLQHGRIY